MKNIVLMAKNFSLLLCLCGCLAAQAEQKECGRNLLYEINGTTLVLTSNHPDSTATLDTDDFMGNTVIKSVTFPGNVILIGTQAFIGCKSLATVNLGNVDTIGAFAFSACTSLEEITLPASVDTIGGNAFYGCTNLQKVTCLSTTPPALSNQDVFANCHSNLEICVPTESVAMYQNYFNNWGLLYSSIISDCKDVPTDIDNTHVDVAATKIIESNQLIIIRNNEKYTITGKKL